MRKIGYLPEESQAQIFSDYLKTQEIDNQVRENDEGWAIWVYDEDQLQEAKKQLRQYKKNPQDNKYTREAKKAKALKRGEKKSQREYEKNFVDVKENWQRLESPIPVGPVTLFFMLVSIIVTLSSSFGSDLDPIRSLLISETLNYQLEEVAQGQIWRLVTPIFIHFGILHILFNMLWLKDLGSMIEHRHNSTYLLVMTLLLAVSSNYLQFYFSGPRFGGMSGVVYGLLGYIWVRGSLDPLSGLFVDRTIVTLMLLWFVFCFFSPRIANAAHAAGLAGGALWGVISSGYLKKKWQEMIQNSQ